MLKIEFLSDYFLRAPRRKACHSAGQRRTRITLHRHIKNSALNKGRSRYSLLFCNRNYSVVIFHQLKEILLRIIFSDQTGITYHVLLFFWRYGVWLVSCICVVTLRGCFIKLPCKMILEAMKRLSLSILKPHPSSQKNVNYFKNTMRNTRRLFGEKYKAFY